MRFNSKPGRTKDLVDLAFTAFCLLLDIKMNCERFCVICCVPVHFTVTANVLSAAMSCNKPKRAVMIFIIVISLSLKLKLVQI